jgi:hypothetical protein
MCVPMISVMTVTMAVSIMFQASCLGSGTSKVVNKLDAHDELNEPLSQVQTDPSR